MNFQPHTPPAGRDGAGRDKSASTDCRIALLGEALIDAFPDRDVPGGAPFNVARNLAALGEPPLLITRIGEDPRGERITAEFIRFGMTTAGLQRDPAHASGLVQVQMQAHAHRFEIGPDQAWDHLDAGAACAELARTPHELIYFGTLAQRAPASRLAVRAALAASPARRFLDLNLRAGPDNQALAAESMLLADIVKANDDELDALLQWFVRPGRQAPWGDPGHHADVMTLMARFKLQRLVVTRGARGWACFAPHATEPFMQGPSPEVTLRDTVGAGDAFSTVLLLGEIRGWSLATTLARASHFAASICTLQGAVDDTHAIYRTTLRTWS